MTEPTDETAEKERGRVALWLDPADLETLSRRCLCNDETPDPEREFCARVRFRARAALHKAGLV